MKTFEQFLTEQEKRVKLYGLGAPTSKLVKSIKPARPAKPVYSGMAVQQIFPVPRCGKPKSGVIGS